MSEEQNLPTQERPAKPPKSRLGLWLRLVSLVALLAVIVYFTMQEIGELGLSSGLPAEEVADPALGPETAPVVITQYSDLGCPACRSWHSAGIRDQVVATFGDQVRFVWKDYPRVTPLSPQGAEAGLCAAAQGRFWEFHDTLYQENAGLENDALRGYASSVGLDLAAFDDCVEQRLMRHKVRASEQEARRIGLRSTPAFTINGQPLPAPPSFNQLVILIQQELANTPQTEAGR
jgi:protein-disulfide isomerase